MTYTVQQINAMARAYSVLKPATLSAAVYVAPEIFSGDTIDYQEMTYTGGYPSPALSSISMVINGSTVGTYGTGSGNSYTSLPTDVGPLIVRQNASNTVGTTVGDNSSVSIVTPVKFTNLFSLGVNCGSIGYNNAILGSFGFAVPAAPSTAIPRYLQGQISFTSGGSPVTSGSNVLATLGGINTILFGTTVDEGQVFTLEDGNTATIITHLTTTTCMVNLNGTLSKSVHQYCRISIPLDANGWPTVASSLVLSAPPVGSTADGNMPSSSAGLTYTVSYNSPGGTTTMTVAGSVGVTLSAPVVSGTLTTYQMTLTSNVSGVTCFVNFNGPITNLDIPLNLSTSSLGGPLFANAGLAYYAQFQQLRLMDFLNTNGRTDTIWSSRPKDFYCQCGFNPSWERVLAFINAVLAYPGSNLKQVYINFPFNIDSDVIGLTSNYASQVAAMFTAALPTSLIVSYENSNEVWNSGSFFTVYHKYINDTASELLAVTNNSVNVNWWTSSSGNLITGVSRDSTGLVTVTLANAVNTYLNSSGNPYIVDQANIVAIHNNDATFSGKNSTSTFFNGSTNVYLIKANVPSPTGNTFTYQAAGTTAASSTSSGLNIFFNLTSKLLLDNSVYDINSLYSKFHVRKLYCIRNSWISSRASASYPLDRCILSMQIWGNGASGQNRYPPIHYSYGQYISGAAQYTIPWCYGAVIAPYCQTASSDTSDSIYTSMNNAISGIISNSIRSHVYQCRLYGLHPMAYEGGPDYTYSPAQVVTSSSDSRIGTVVTNLLTTWYANGGEDFFFYNGTPRIWTNTVSAGFALVQTFNDTATTSPKLGALLSFYSAIRNYANVNGNGATSLATVAYYQVATNASTVGGNVYTTTTATPQKIFAWYANNANRAIDFLIPVTRSRRYQVVVYGTDSVGTTSVDVYIDNVYIGSTNLVAGGNGSSVSAVAAASNAINVSLLQSGVRVVSIRLPSGRGNVPGIMGVGTVKY